MHTPAHGTPAASQAPTVHSPREYALIAILHRVVLETMAYPPVRPVADSYLPPDMVEDAQRALAAYGLRQAPSPAMGYTGDTLTVSADEKALVTAADAGDGPAEVVLHTPTSSGGRYTAGESGRVSTGGQELTWWCRSHGSTYGTTWFGRLGMLDPEGRVWQRDFDAVIDDFGDLVEVVR